MEQQATLESVKIDEDLVRDACVAMTPSIMINGKMMEDPFDYEAFQAAIEQELKDRN